MSDIRVVEMKDLDDSMITIDELCKIVGQTKLTVQKKIAAAKLETVAMLRSGKPGRPSRLFNRSEVNALFDIHATAKNSSSENVSSDEQNNQGGSVASESVSPSP